MSREDANLVIAIAGLVVAVVASWAAIYAIHRDQADLQVMFSAAAMGNRHLIVVNVGLRPVRIQKVLVRDWMTTPRFAKTKYIGGAALLDGPDGQETTGRGPGLCRNAHPDRTSPWRMPPVGGTASATLERCHPG